MLQKRSGKEVAGDSDDDADKHSDEEKEEQVLDEESLRKRERASILSRNRHIAILHGALVNSSSLTEDEFWDWCCQCEGLSCDQ